MSGVGERVDEQGASAARPLRLCLFGAPSSNTNLGLGALMRSTVVAATDRSPGTSFVVFEDARGVRRARIEVNGGYVPYTVMGARLSRRLHWPESYASMTVAAALRLPTNPGAQAVRRADAVLDVSGGDSFSDIYGEHRFRTVCAPKRLALRSRRPLVLLPQTYGPFVSATTRGVARELVLRAEHAWARDADSFAALCELVGDGFDAGRHHAGVDLAFLLPPARPPALPLPVAAALAGGDAIGVNVSGLLWNHQDRFGLADDYQETMLGAVRKLLDESAAPVVLVPHVLGRRPGGEADNVANAELVARLPAPLRARVVAVDWPADAARAKWAISRCAWFLGARMHSTIAALSSGVPCAAMAYSQKYRGVFGSCGLADEVLDARALQTADLIDAVIDAHRRRDGVRAALGEQLPATLARADAQMRAILQSVSSG